VSICFHRIRIGSDLAETISAPPPRVSTICSRNVMILILLTYLPPLLLLLLLYALGRTLSIKPERLGTSSYQSFWRDAFSIRTVSFFSSRRGGEKMNIIIIIIIIITYCSFFFVGTLRSCVCTRVFFFRPICIYTCGKETYLFEIFPAISHCATHNVGIPTLRLCYRNSFGITIRHFKVHTRRIMLHRGLLSWKEGVFE